MNRIEKIKITKELNEKDKKLFKLAHMIANKANQQTWDIMRDQLGYLLDELSGGQILDSASTLAANFLSGFMLCMKKVADSDDTQYTLDELLNSVFYAVSKMIDTKEIKLPEKKITT
jgi:ABC-type ATPase with predicted acetyltransferase domain